MSPKQWFALLCLYIFYLFLGSLAFYYIEHNKELENRAIQLQERIKINELLVKYASPGDKETQNNVLQRLSGYCGRPVTNYTLDEYPVDFEWNYFHSFWFSFIICSTVGYGNSSPHDQPGQAFLILYAFIGLPLNGFVLAYLGEFFSKPLIAIYHRCKGYEYTKTENYNTAKRFGLIGTIMTFIVPGLAFFIFLPACLFTYFEDWPYVRSVYYSFVTLTTIGFGDFVPTFQDGQARKFGTYFTLYQTFIIFWNIIGVGYFIMIISYVAKGIYSKRLARLEHQLSMNIKETQHRIWTEVTKDLSFLRSFLNEVNMLKFKPVYKDSAEKINFDLLPRSLSCPELTMYRSELHLTVRKRAYSENNSIPLDSSIINLNRGQSDGDLSRIDKNKTFEGSDTLFHTKDLLSNVLTALGSIKPRNDDVQSCLELSMYDGLNEQEDSPKSSFEWTWNGNNPYQIKEYIRKKKRSIFSLFPDKSGSTNLSEAIKIEDTDMPMKAQNESFMSKMNPFKDRVLSQEGKRYSVSSQDSNFKTYLENTSKGRESRVSIARSVAENMELLENITIADLMRAVDEVQAKSDISPESPLLEDYRVDPRVAKIYNRPRRVSLRPVPTYTTIFMSRNMKSQNHNLSNINRASGNSRRHSVVPPIDLPKSKTKRLRSISWSLPPDQTTAQNTAIQASTMLHRTLSLGPSLLASNTSTQTSARTISPMPMITIQPPNVTSSSLLWHPEFEKGTEK